MAGRETSGYDYKNTKMFEDAHFLIVKGKLSKPYDIEPLEKIARALKFKKTIVLTAEEHDALIAYTSQLTHLIAVGLVQSDHSEKTKDATGDSYRDLTRIAKINEELWTHLFLDNREALLAQMTYFMQEMHHLKTLILDNDHPALKAYLKQAKEKRKLIDTY